ncbi:MFS transporter [Maribacter polysaccharolyticus]|uniref:MFS transporter n=1 Tax=Maribacter polysaccharolyticus TaxID=3020831 RepID=UPI00237FA10E|nr:MFS transporter [Maribacter polysaccharolyticus]MDE3740290.1 MFS transporter [Maribacter polysaccharolyticus]
MIKTLKAYSLRVFDIEESELKKTLLLQLNIFLLITTLLIVKPTINSLFLSELSSDALPVGYVLTALMAIIGSYFYDRALEKYPLKRIIERTLIGSILSLMVFGIWFNLNIANGLLLYIPYIWVAIFGLLVASQFWILANLVYNVREAKRVFGFIGAGAIAGGIFGGYLTSLLASFINTESLFFIAAALLACCLPIMRYIWKHEVEKLNPFQVSLRSTPKGDSPFKLIKQSKLLILIATVIGISVLVAKLVDYQYSDYASRLIEDQEELTVFFGFWFSTLSLISLLIQLFLTKRIVGIFGVGKSLLWLPSGILFGSLLLLFLPQLWVIILIKVVDGSLKQSINKAATELLSIPIPIEIKKKTKTFTDVVVDSLATGLAGFILIFFINALEIPSTYVSLIIIVLISIWLYFIYHLRKEYITTFKKIFEPSKEKVQKPPRPEKEVTAIVPSVIRVFQNGSEGQILHMLQKTLDVKDERFFEAIKGLIRHESAKVRALAIENLYFLRTENLSQELTAMVYDSDQKVTSAAFRYLLKNHDSDTVGLFNKYLGSEDPTIANAALIGLSMELRNNKSLQEQFQLEEFLKQAIGQLDSLISKEEKRNKLEAILEAIGQAKVEKYYPMLEEYLMSSDLHVLKKAIFSASKTLDPRFIDCIISHLSGKEVRKTALEALYNYGDPIIDILIAKVREDVVDLEDANHIVLVIEKFASQKAVNSLLKLTEGTEHSIKMEAIEALRRLKWKHPNLKITDKSIITKIVDECQLYQITLSAIHSQILVQYKKKSVTIAPDEVEARNNLIRLLEQRLDRQLERIFKFLGVKYPPSDVDPLLDIILKGKEEQRIHAIEFLDNILNYQLKSVLIPITESVLVDSVSDEKIRKLNIKTISETECYQTLLARKDMKLKQAVLSLIETIGDNAFAPIVQSALTDTNKKIRERAAKVLASLNEDPIP